MKINLNDIVRVKLTPFGRKVHRENHVALYAYFEHLPHYVPPTEDANGWSRWQLWSLMEQFGPYVHFGSVLCFETTIVLEKK